MISFPDDYQVLIGNTSMLLLTFVYCIVRGLSGYLLRWKALHRVHPREHRCTLFENPGGGSMRFLPNFGREGIKGL